MGDAEAERLNRELARRNDEVAILKRVAVELGGTLELGPLLEKILASMDEVFGFSHAMVLLHDRARDLLAVSASRGYPESGVGAEVRMGEGIIGVVAKRRKLMRVGGMIQQRGYMTALRERVRDGEGTGAGVSAEVPLPGLANLASMVAIPLVARDELIGVFAVESEKAAVFDDEDLGLIEAVASQAGLAIQNARLMQSEKDRRAELEEANLRLTTWNEASSRFVPYEFLEILGHRQLPDVRRGDSAEKLMSAFFSDIRGYTTIVESQGAKENFDFINEYLAHMELPIRDHAGIIESYHGDGILALFGGPPRDAVEAAVASMRALAAYNAEARAARGLPPVRIGIGIDTGWLMLGTMGGMRRLAASVIGDCANTASRVEGATKLYGAPVLITEHTRDGLDDASAFRMRAIDRVRPRGKKNPVTLFEVLDGLPEEELAGKLASGEPFAAGWQLYQGGRPGDALVHFAEALRRFPADRAAQLYVGRCWQLIEHGVPEGWDGVMDLTTK
jgi:adenylate cyclase